jgi:cell shape-determining protein MreC
LLFLLLIGLSFWKLSSNFLGGVIGEVVSPILSGYNSIAVKLESFQSYMMSKSDLLSRNTELERLLEMHRLEIYELDELRKDNADMKQALGRLPSDHTFALASVLASPITTAHDTVLIDLGMYEGVGAGMQVFHSGGFAIGVVATAYRHSSLVTLYSTNGSEIEGYVGTSSIPITLHGVGGGNFRISVPRGTEVFVGDSVRLPAFSPTFVGVVEAIDTPEESSFSTVYIKLPFDYQRLRSVYVAVPTNSRT